MVNYNELKEVIDQFNRELPRPNLTLVLGELSPIKTKQMWQNADKAGIYFLFDQNENLQYIGKASFGSNIGVRIGTRFSSKDCRCFDSKFEIITQVATIALPDDRVFEVPSIEEYLIGNLRPPLNVLGV